MRWLQHGMAAWIFWGGMMLSGFAQSLPDGLANQGAAKPPDSGIRDENGFFNKNSGATKRISDRIRKLEADHGFRIFLMVEPVLIATTAPELAAQLQQSWLPDGGGLVVVFEADSRSLGFGQDAGGPPGKEEVVGLVPAHDSNAILGRARDATAAELAPEAYIEALMGNLVIELDSYFKRRAEPRPAGRSLRLALLTVGALALLALAGIAVGFLARLPSMDRARSYRFPVVDRPERLGAPCGGGNVTTRRFEGGPRS